MDSFDKAYARYLGYLSKLDTVEDISEKKLLFRELTVLLSDMEEALRTHSYCVDPSEPLKDGAVSTFWI